MQVMGGYDFPGSSSVSCWTWVKALDIMLRYTIFLPSIGPVFVEH